MSIERFDFGTQYDAEEPYATMFSESDGYYVRYDDYEELKIATKELMRAVTLGVRNCTAEVKAMQKLAKLISE